MFAPAPVSGDSVSPVVVRLEYRRTESQGSWAGSVLLISIPVGSTNIRITTLVSIHLHSPHLSLEGCGVW